MYTPETREYRKFSFNQLSEMRATGIPVVFNTPTVIDYDQGLPIYEMIDSRAFETTVMKNVPLVVDHAGKPCATMRNDSLKLEVKPDGLYMEADLSTTPAGRELHEYLKSGAYNEMSFAFTIAEASYDKNTRTITIRKIDTLYDVSVVMWGAYPTTSVAARSLLSAEADQEIVHKQEAAEAARSLAEAEAELQLAKVKSKT